MTPSPASIRDCTEAMEANRPKLEALIRAIAIAVKREGIDLNPIKENADEQYRAR